MAVRPITIAILAMGGEGGGVLADWIADLAQHEGWLAQSTSVAGVAQRTGATIYYLELFPRAEAEREGLEPVLALIPTPGDVDVLLASELMEAGRAVQRGLVTPDRTTLIASSHRVHSIAEKSAPGDGRVDASVLDAACAAAARRVVRFDMAEVAERHSSVISAVLLGALAGAEVLPFGRAAFEAAIRRGGVGAERSLQAFDEAFARARPPAAPLPPADPPKLLRDAPASHPDARVDALLQRLRREFAADERAWPTEGVRRLLDYQDPAYAAQYLDRLQPFARRGDAELRAAVARQLALWMSYEDTIRVADLKTRASRFERVRAEVRAAPQQPLSVHEYLHPRLQEVCDTLPAALGRWLLGAGAPKRLVERLTRRGRTLDTASLRGFLLLFVVASLRRWRRGTLRHATESARIDAWLARLRCAAAADPALALEIALCQGLVKGYGDTHERGWQRFEALMAAADKLEGRADAAVQLRRLRLAARADEDGRALQATLAAAGLDAPSGCAA